MDAKYLNLRLLDQKILTLAEKGYNATEIAIRLFKPLSLSRLVRYRISALRKKGKLQP